MEGDVAVGNDGVKGNGSYCADWNGRFFPSNKKLETIRSEDAVKKVVQHTDEVVHQACEESKIYL